MKSLRFQAVLAWTITALLGSLVSCSGQKTTEVPDELIGVWTTTAGDYSDRSLELRYNSLLIGTGEGTPSLNLVVEVTQELAAGATAYTIAYRDLEADEFKLYLLYDAAQRELRLKNRPGVKWTKQGGGEPAEGGPGG